MQKNIAIACGIGDLFTFLTRLDDFFNRNKEYKSVKFWTWLHTPELAKDFVSYDKHNVEIMSVNDMTKFLEEVISDDVLEQARKMFIRQNKGGEGVEKYVQFINTFFPNMEEWISLQVYEKYKTTYPYTLEVPPYKGDRPYIVVHPFSQTVKTEKLERTWSHERWSGLLKQVLNYTDYDIYIVGTSKDIVEPKNNLIGSTSNARDRVHDVRGVSSIKQTIALVYGSEAVLGINSWITELSAWAEIPTYAQWFVQHQLIKSHYPKPVNFMKHLYIQKNLTSTPEAIRYYHPTVVQAWNGVRRVLDYAKHTV